MRRPVLRLDRPSLKPRSAPRGCRAQDSGLPDGRLDIKAVGWPLPIPFAIAFGVRTEIRATLGVPLDGSGNSALTFMGAGMKLRLKSRINLIESTTSLIAIVIRSNSD